MTFDIELLGDCDIIISELCQRLGGNWNNLPDGYDIPGIERKPLSPEGRGATGEEHERVNSEETGRQDSDQMPQCALNQESSAPCDLKQPTEDAIPVNQQSPVDGRVTVGESSSYEETSVDSLRDQPKASVGGEVNECSNENEAASGEDTPRYLFMPPSRYIFYGAEVMDSPLPSPRRNISGYLDSSSEASDSVGDIDDNEASCYQLDGIIEDLMGQGCERTDSCVQDGCKPSNSQTTANGAQLSVNSSESESNSDDGFGEGEGDLDKALEPIINSEATRQALSLILGGLSSYTCESEENSRLSGSDDPVTAGSSVTSDPDCFSSAVESLLADRPFSAVTLDTPLAKRDCLEPETLDRVEDAERSENDATDGAVAVTRSDS